MELASSFYNQPLVNRFGTEFLNQVDPSVEPYWDSLDIAVAFLQNFNLFSIPAPLKGAVYSIKVRVEFFAINLLLNHIEVKVLGKKSAK